MGQREGSVGLGEQRGWEANRGQGRAEGICVMHYSNMSHRSWQGQKEAVQVTGGGRERAARGLEGKEGRR